MLKAKSGLMLAGFLFLGVFCVSSALAQDTTPPAGGAGGGRGRGGRGGPGGGMFDPNVMRQRMADQMKTALGCTDEEWTALAPKVEKVQTLQRDLRGGGMFGGGMMGGRGRGGPGAPGGDAGAPAAPAAPAPTTDVGKAAAALSKVLENKDAAPADIKTALQALRDAKAKAKTALEAAQKELKDVLTVRQEAAMVERGLLD
jgi:hypothetical protein